jgi:hypothetical protein
MIYLCLVGPLRSVPQLPRSAMLIVRHLARGYMYTSTKPRGWRQYARGGEQ